jgi:hypothetical protein
MKLIDNALSEYRFKDIEKIVFSDDFPWFYANTAYGDKAKSNLFSYSYSNTVFAHGTFYDIHGQILLSITKELLQKAGEQFKSIERIRIGSIPATEKTLVHDAHVDFVDAHKTALFYLNDSDGDTIIYNERFDTESKVNAYDQYISIKDQLTVNTRVTPKANRLFCFDGLMYHSSSTTTSVDRRIVMNINYTVED